MTPLIGATHARHSTLRALEAYERWDSSTGRLSSGATALRSCHGVPRSCLLAFLFILVVNDSESYNVFDSG